MESKREMEALGLLIAKSIDPGNIVFIQGDLGSGKTTIARGILHGFGYEGVVTSPTYTLVELYELVKFRVAHMDLYRIESTEELEAIGLRDYFDGQTIFLIEWPEQFSFFFPKPNLRIYLKLAGEGRKVWIERLKPKYVEL